MALVVEMGWHLSYLFSGLHFLLYHCIMRTFSQSHIPSAPRPASLTLEEVLTSRETEVSGMLSQQDKNKEDAGVILDGGRVMSQEEENLSLSRTREFVRMLSVLCSGRGLPSVLCEEQLSILFPACMSVLWRKSRLPVRGCQIWLSFVPLPKCLTMSSGQLKSK